MDADATTHSIDCDENMSRDELIENYFHIGFKYLEIIMFLAVMPGHTLGLRQLKRILRERNLFRRKFKGDIRTVADVIEQELSGSACNLGYRYMHRKLLQVHRMVTDRETVRSVLKYLDPNGVISSQRRRLKRRDYNGKGLKQYGFCIHGCIDGFSRRIMWLDVAASNNDPFHVCTNFADTVISLGGIPYVIRADRGTENGNIEMMQTYLRSINRDTRSSLHATFLYGKSTATQRIEAWWSKFQPQGMLYWIFDTSDEVDSQCARFCYMNLLRSNLQVISQLWNTHHLRKSRNRDSPHGKPEVIYHFPEMYGSRNYLRCVNAGDLRTLSQSLVQDVPDCTASAVELFTGLVEEGGLQMPRSVVEADDLFVHLLDAVNRIDLSSS